MTVPDTEQPQPTPAVAEIEIAGSPVCVRLINVDQEPSGLNTNDRIAWAEDIIENLERDGRIQVIGSAYLELAKTPGGKGQ